MNLLVNTAPPTSPPLSVFGLCARDRGIWNIMIRDSFYDGTAEMEEAAHDLWGWQALGRTFSIMGQWQNGRFGVPGNEIVFTFCLE